VYNHQQFQAPFTHKETPEELPSVSFVRTFDVLVEVMGETTTAIKLANAPEWLQLWWTDSTTRCKIPFTTLIIGIQILIHCLVFL
jgi:hypothetical protein